MGLGTKLRRGRERRGVDRATLSRRAGLPRTYVARIENGEIKSPRIDTVRKLARALGVPITELVE